MITGKGRHVKMGGIMTKAPNSLIWAVALCFLGVVAAFCWLAGTGSDTADLRTFLNTVLNIVAAVFSGGALVVAGAAAKSAGNTEDHTNGILTKRDKQLADQGDTITRQAETIAILRQQGKK